MVYDALEMTYRKIKVRKDPEGEPITELIDYEAFCGVVSDEAQEAAAGSTITVDELKDMMDAGKDFELIDVREPNEYEIVSIPGATLIPKDEILSGRALSQLPQDKPIVLHCKTGCALGRGARRGQGGRLQGRRPRAGRRDGVGHAHRQGAAHLLTTRRLAEGPAPLPSPGRRAGPSRMFTGRMADFSPVELLELFQRAQAQFTDRVDAVEPDQWEDEALPGWTVGDLVAHLVTEQLWVPPLLAGEPFADRGRFPDDTDDLLGDDPFTGWETAADAALSAFAEDDALMRTVHLDRAARRRPPSTSSR